MNSAILGLLDYVTENFDSIKGNIITVVGMIYILYGVILALDARKRYHSKLNPVFVFFGWIFFSIIFLPIYIVVRPDRYADERHRENSQSKAILLGSGLSQCSHCNEVVKSTDKYCYQCGYPTLKACKHCSAELDPHWQFCNTCGKPVAEEVKSKHGIRDIAQKFKSKFKHNSPKLLSSPVLTPTPEPQPVYTSSPAAPVMQEAKLLPIVAEPLAMTETEEKVEKPTEVKEIKAEEEEKNLEIADEKKEKPVEEEKPVKEQVKESVKQEEMKEEIKPAKPEAEKDQDPEAKYKDSANKSLELAISNPPHPIDVLGTSKGVMIS